MGGNFITYAATATRNRLVRLNTDGTTDTAFCTNAVDATKFSAAVNMIAQQSDGKLLIGGTFTNYAATTNRSRLIRLNTDGTIDAAFCVNAADGAKLITQYLH